MSKKNKKYPYIILSILHTTLLIYSCYKSKERKTLLILLFSNIGMAYFFEYFVINLFNGYCYMPKFFKNKSIDKTVGAIFSQGIFIPFTALFITALQLGWKTKLAFAGYFAFVEMLFLRIDVYTHRWWNTAYTLVLIPFYFLISDMWYKHLKKGTPAVLFLSLFFFIMSTCINVIFVRAVKGKVKFGVGHVHSWREHLVISPLYSIGLSLLTALILMKKQRFPILTVMYFRVFIDFILIKYKWLRTKKNNVLDNLAAHLFVTVLSGYFRNLVYGSE